MVRKFPILLIIDDSKAFRTFCRESIKNSVQWIHIIEAKDGIEGLKRYQLNKPDVILLDMNMPRLDGTKVLDLIRKNDSDTKIIVTSAYTNEQDTINHLIKLGATCFIPKPMNKIGLIQGITQALATGKVPGTRFLKDLPAK